MRIFVIASVLVLSGCSTVEGWFGDGKAAPEPQDAVAAAPSGDKVTITKATWAAFENYKYWLTPIAWLHHQKRLDVAKPVGLWGAYVIGLAFAFGWTPCIGPILAAILAVAASEQTVARGALLLAVYSLGLGIPFIVAAFAIEPFAAFLARFKKYLRRVEQAMGALLVLTGIAFLTGGISQLSIWLLEVFPALGKIG